MKKSEGVVVNGILILPAQEPLWYETMSTRKYRAHRGKGTFKPKQKHKLKNNKK
jgi:hypothetical protein